MTIDNDDLDALEAVARAATPGPWETRCEGYGEPTWVCHDSEYVIYLGYDYAAELGAEDGAHIATFDPPTVRALITRVREAETRLREAETVITNTLDGLSDVRVPAVSRVAMSQAVLGAYKPTNQEGSDDGT